MLYTQILRTNILRNIGVQRHQLVLNRNFSHNFKSDRFLTNANQRRHFSYDFNHFSSDFKNISKKYLENIKLYSFIKDSEPFFNHKNKLIQGVHFRTRQSIQIVNNLSSIVKEKLSHNPLPTTIIFNKEDKELAQIYIDLYGVNKTAKQFLDYGLKNEGKVVVTSIYQYFIPIFTGSFIMSLIEVPYSSNSFSNLYYFTGLIGQSFFAGLLLSIPVAFVIIPLNMEKMLFLEFRKQAPIDIKAFTQFKKTDQK